MELDSNLFQKGRNENLSSSVLKSNVGINFNAIRHIKRSKLTPFAPYQAATPTDREPFKFGGILSNKALAWIASGNVVSLYWIHTGEIFGRWEFQDLRGNKLQILCVSDATITRNVPDSMNQASDEQILVVAVQSFDYPSKCELRCLSLSECVTVRIISLDYLPSVMYSLSLISPTVLGEDGAMDTEGAGVLNQPANPLRHIRSPLIIGTKGGHVLILDLYYPRTASDANMEKIFFGPEVSKSHQTPIENLSTARYIFDPTGNVHPVVQLNLKENHLQAETFSYLKSEVSQRSVVVTCIIVLHEIDAFVIGYNFGGFQLWSLKTLSILYTQNLIELGTLTLRTDQAPITHFAYQNATTDNSRGFFWTIRGKSSISKHPVLNDSIYKDWTTSYVSLHELELSNSTVNNIKSVKQVYTREVKDDQTKITKFNTCFAIKNGHQGNKSQNDKSTVSSRIAFVWEQLSFNSNKETIVELFDLHQLRKCNTQSTSNLFTQLYSGQILLNEETSMSCAVDNGTIIGYDDPNEVSFDLMFLTHLTTIVAQFGGPKQLALEQQFSNNDWFPAIEEKEKSRKLLDLLRKVGLLTKDIESKSSNELELVFSVLLENNRVHKICNYITAMGEDSFILANPKPVLQWIHKIFDNLTQSINYKSIMLAPSLNQSFTQREKMELKNKLSESIVRLADLRLILKKLIDRRDTSKEGLEALTEKSWKIQLEQQYVEVVDWLVDQDLLPSSQFFLTWKQLTNTMHESLNSVTRSLEELYNQRRLSRGLRYKATSRTLNEIIGRSPSNFEIPLFIDSLMESASSPDTLNYPPKDIFQLLNVIRTGDPNFIQQKRSIIFYFLLDVEDQLSLHDKMNVDFSQRNQIPHSPQLAQSFAENFSMSESHQKLLHSFWLLDSAASLLSDSQQEQLNAHLWKACNQLIDPSVEIDWVTKILRTFYDFAAYSQALAFVSHIGSTSALITLDDQLVYIDLLLKNHLFYDAWNFERKFTLSAEGTDSQYLPNILKLLFNYCLTNYKMKELLYLPLDKTEEDCLIEYLSQNKQLDLIIMYYFERSRYKEALAIYTKLQSEHKTSYLPYEESLHAIMLNVADILKIDKESLNPATSSSTPVMTPVPRKAISTPKASPAITPSVAISPIAVNIGTPKAGTPRAVLGLAPPMLTPIRGLGLGIAPIPSSPAVFPSTPQGAGIVNSTPDSANKRDRVTPAFKAIIQSHRIQTPPSLRSVRTSFANITPVVPSIGSQFSLQTIGPTSTSSSSVIGPVSTPTQQSLSTPMSPSLSIMPIPSIPKSPVLDTGAGVLPPNLSLTDLSTPSFTQSQQESLLVSQSQHQTQIESDDEEEELTFRKSKGSARYDSS